MVCSLTGAWLLLLIVTGTLPGQSTNISGVINSYTKVIEINGANLRLLSAGGFSKCQKVLIIQMKGASINTTNTSDYGSITSLNGAGAFEFNRIAAVNGNVITLSSVPSKPFDVSGLVQIVSVPEYENAEVTSALRAATWNGSTGGVLVFDVHGTLTLRSNISVSGQGFRGGSVSNNGSISNVMEHFNSYSSNRGGEKGEGVAAHQLNAECCRGRLGNGGGGGNGHNAGGAGGSNGGTGGKGGFQHNGAPSIDIGGYGGVSLPNNPANPKAFLGGGGGGGHQNGSLGTPGMAGGGIVIIKANSIASTGGIITADGIDNTLVAGNDGSGGGGAGGTVLLDIQNWTTTITISAKGGFGGSTNNSNNSTQCHGPGGGGSGGKVMVNGMQIPPQLTTQLTGGVPGLNITYPSPCLNQPYGATAGATGDVDSALVLPQTAAGGPLVPTITRIGDTLMCSPALTYQWQYEGVDLPGRTQQRLLIDRPGRYTVVVTDSNGCNPRTEFLVEANPLTIQTNTPPPVCRDSCTTLTATCSGGVPPYRFRWTPTTGLLYPDSSIVRACPRSSTIYSVTVTDNRGVQQTSTVTVTVYPAPAPPVITHKGDTLFASDAVSYQWYVDGQPIPGATAQWLLPKRTGVYSVRVHDPNGCPAQSDTTRFAIPTISAIAGLGCVDSIAYAPGAEIRFPIFIHSISPARPVEISSATAYIHFEKNVLQPMPDSAVSFADSGRIRHAQVHVRAGDLSTGVFCELPAIVMLGDTVCTLVVLDSLVMHAANDFRVTLQDTLCRVCVRVCEEGGTRLYRSYAGVMLRQNHPNPFNATTVLEYRLPEPAFVRLDVFDSRGRLVATPSEGFREAGIHRAVFDAGVLPSGIFAAVLKTGQSMRIVYMTVLK
jgi:hypothetical protein